MCQSLRLMLNKPVGLPHSKQVEDCSRELAASTACLSDPWAGQLARLQSFMSKVDDDHHAHKTVFQSAGAEVLTQIFSIRYTRELEELKSSVARALVGCPKPVGELVFQPVHLNILTAIQSASCKWKLNAPSCPPCGFAS